MMVVIFLRGLYIHIPFCKSICSYCDFPKRIPQNERMIEAYIIRLLDDLKQYKIYYDSVETIYIGGGTPNILSKTLLENLLKELSIFKNVKEFTIEINPEGFDLEYANILKKYQINRVSIGVQTFNEDNLKLLGRNHNNNDVFKTISILKQVGINNINIDLIFSIPGQNVKDVVNDLEIFYSLDIPHLSFYSLILEEKTKLSYQISKGILTLNDEDLDALLYTTIMHSLKMHGYKQYEISNYSKDGYESIHNKIYWQAKEYIGVGAGASGYLNSIRYKNHIHINDYLNEFIKERIFLSDSDKLSEKMILGLRMTDGINIVKVKQEFGVDPLQKFDLESLFKYNLIEIKDNNLKLTEKGILLGNEVFEKFI